MAKRDTQRKASKTRSGAKRDQPRPAVTSLTAAARQQLIQADVLSLEATRARTPEITKGIFGTRRLRASGSLAAYMIGQPTFDVPKVSKPPRVPRSQRPKPRGRGSAAPTPRPAPSAPSRPSRPAPKARGGMVPPTNRTPSTPVPPLPTRPTLPPPSVTAPKAQQPPTRPRML